ncbi:serine/threonine-protein kinase [Amorphus orientalis]|uniref:Protein kinase domain-containing protein n=1 Tax=Amorphus orientalis TaxID=649198 RepID=A0AAE3VM67_9HYPH|nr:serine/threonine-protein kinase [Amorphus orientalis]MDQ0314305.1 hypothetical protein [Amorphus orientalis]
MVADAHDGHRDKLEAFLSGRLSYVQLISELRNGIVRGSVAPGSLGEVLGEYSASGRLPHDLVPLIIQEVQRGPGHASESDVEEDDEATVRRAPEDGQGARRRSAIDDRVDDVVLQALVEEYKALKGGDAPAQRQDDTDLDHFMSAFVGARLRRTAERTETEASGGASTAAPSASPQTKGGRARVGSLLKERFVLDREIGGGAMGRVYAAVDRRRLEAGDGRPYVAIKVLDRQFGQDSRAFRTLEAEARKAQALAHPNIVHVYDFDRDGPDAFIVMELLRGRPLDEELDRRGRPIPLEETLAMLAGAFTGLGFAHERDVLHCDIKPSNIFLCADGTTKLVDFGIASASTLPVFDVDELASFTGRYAAPEVIEHQIRTPAADVYSMACVVYEMLSGAPPFGDRTSVDARELGKKPANLNSLDRRQMSTLRDALAFDMDQRIASVAEFRSRLEDTGRRWFGR